MNAAETKRPLRRWWLVLVLVAAGLCTAFIVAAQDRPKPRVGLVTSLPFLMGEGFGLDLDASAAPMASTLGRKVDLVPIGVTEASELAGLRYLLMLHPRAQTAEGLVDLDTWVRGGGRLLLTADPRLDFESSRPLGDRLRPPPDFADTGLLAHWGLLMEDGGDGRARFVTKAGSSCEVDKDELRADCEIGKGRVIVLGDSDPVMAEAGDADANALLGVVDQLLHG